MPLGLATRLASAALAAASFVVPAPRASVAPAPGFVGRDGDRLVVDGAPWTFVGVNIYNANSRDTCWYPMRDGELRRAFERTGASAIRAWFFQPMVVTPAGALDWSAFDETVASARRAGVRVVATLGNHWSDCDRQATADIEWYRSGYRQADVSPRGDRLPLSYRDYVAAVVTRYRDEPAIAAWQLINEPSTNEAGGRCPADAAAVLRSFTVDVARLIRSLDGRHLVTQGTIGSGQCGTAGPEYDRLVADAGLDWCELHDYYGPEAVGGDEWNGMATRIARCQGRGLPVVIGEQGLDPARVGGLGARATAVAGKIDAARALGVDGYLVWAYADPPPGYGDGDHLAVRPDDPLLVTLRDASTRWSR